MPVDDKLENQTSAVPGLQMYDNRVKQDFAVFDPHLAAPKTPRIWGLSTEREGRVISGRRRGSQRSMARGLPGQRAKRRSRTLVLCHLWC